MANNNHTYSHTREKKHVFQNNSYPAFTENFDPAFFTLINPILGMCMRDWKKLFILKMVADIFQFVL
jgi:hypothetical protein